LSWVVGVLWVGALGAGGRALVQWHRGGPVGGQEVATPARARSTLIVDVAVAVVLALHVAFVGRWLA